ncbi:MAG: phosphotransferase family protein, partial [Acidimicrobiia bacterium]|nr:phosphotransferase family protein [Acidimicrobiia bacterium]
DWPPGFDDAARGRLGLSLVDALVDLHRLSPTDVALEELGRPDGFVERQVTGWARRWTAAATRPVPAMDEVSRRLAGSVPSPQAAVILHNDFKLDNTMTDDSGGLVAVFDWDMATLGDPLVDVGTMLAYWADPEDPTFLIFGSQAVTLAPHLSKGDVVARYAERSGFDVTDIAFYEALALWRIATIIEQIYARYAAGQTTDERFAGFEPIAPLLATAALAKLGG